AIWPDTAGAFHRVSAKAVTPTSDQPIWDEYGLQEAEEASYESPDTKFTATAYRFQDSTGAMAAFEWMRPPDAKPSTLAKLAAESPNVTLVGRGNYILKFTGYQPAGPLLASVFENL